MAVLSETLKSWITWIGQRSGREWSVVYLDTTFLVRMVSSPNLISRRARRLIGQRELRVSPMVVLELQFLYELQEVRYHETVNTA